MDPDQIVPPQFKVKLAQQMLQAQQGSMPMPPPGAPPGPAGSPPAPVQNGQMLQDGAPIADNFAPQAAA